MGIQLICSRAHRSTEKQTVQNRLDKNTSIEATVLIAAATVAAEYPNGDKNPPFRSFSYLIASKYTLLLEIMPRRRAAPKRA